MLTAQNYDEREQQAADELPNRVIEMVNPMTFASEGYPVRVRHERVLWRYVNVTHEGRFQGDLVTLHDGGFMAQEFDRVKRVAQLACTYSENAFGRKLTTNDIRTADERFLDTIGRGY